MAVAKMICVVPEVVAGTDTEEPAYPDSILNDPQTREQFRAIYIEQDEEPAADEPKPGFWRRQFSGSPTTLQKIFDWQFGVILPVICFAFDPFVFAGPGALLENYAVAAYGLSYLAIMGTMLWMLMGRRLRSLNFILAGLFAISAVVSLAIGSVLFPYSFYGMAFIIGFLGYTPLLMSFSLSRSAVRAYRAANVQA